MRTQETFQLMKAAKEIAVAIDADGDRVGGLLNERDPLPVAEGDPAFDYRKHLKSLRLQLDTARDGVVDTEDEHAARQIRVARRLSERDEVGKSVYDDAVVARQGLESFFPRGGFELAFFKGTTPRNPEKLLEQLVQTVKLLKDPPVEPRQPKNDAFSVDLEKMAANLEPAIDELRAAIDRYDRVNKEAEGSLLNKREAVQKLRRIVVWVGRSTEGLFFLADEDELARRIRKSARRPLRPSEQEPAEEASSDDSPAESPAEAPASP